MEIRSRDEYNTAQRFIQEIGWFWLGANDMQAEGNWVWNSDEEKIVRNEFWANGRPVNRDNNDCLTMTYNGMYDYICNDESGPSVCEYI